MPITELFLRDQPSIILETHVTTDLTNFDNKATDMTPPRKYLFIRFLFQVGMVQPGFVKKVMAYGCFVEFPHNISGLAPLKFLTDEFISSPTGVYEEMQTVWAKVLNNTAERLNDLRVCVHVY